MVQLQGLGPNVLNFAQSVTLCAPSLFNWAVEVWELSSATNAAVSISKPFPPSFLLSLHLPSLFHLFPQPERKLADLTAARCWQWWLFCFNPSLLASCALINQIMFRKPGLFYFLYLFFFFFLFFIPTGVWEKSICSSRWAKLSTTGSRSFIMVKQIHVVNLYVYGN